MTSRSLRTSKPPPTQASSSSSIQGRCSSAPPARAASPGNLKRPANSAGGRDRMATATTTVSDGRHAYRPQAIGRVFGWFFLATFFTSIGAYFIGYAKMLDTPSLITGAGADPSKGIATSAALEVFLIIANVATAVVAYPVLKRESEMGPI